MKVLYADPLSHDTHKYYNINNLKCLEGMCELNTYFRQGYLDGYDKSNLTSYESALRGFPGLLTHLEKKNRLYYFLRSKIGQLRIVIDILKLAKKQNVDMIIFSSVDIIPFWFATLFSRQRIAFIEHSLWLAAERSWMRFFWRKLNHRIEMCVMEPQYFDFVRNQIRCMNPLYLVRHPVNEVVSEISAVNCCRDKRILIYAPSASNDREWISSILKVQERIPDYIKLVVRGNEDFENSRIKVYSQPVEREVYEQYFRESEYILIPYDTDFNYRVSGVLFDAVSRNKKILLKSGNMLSDYSERYKHIFVEFDEIDDMLDKIHMQKNQHDESNQIKEFEQFRENYSKAAIIDDFKRLLDGQAI